MSATQAPSIVLNDGSHCGTSSQDSHADFELVKKDASALSEISCGPDNQEQSATHSKSEHAPSTRRLCALNAASGHRSMLKLQQDLKNLALDALRNGAVSSADAQFPGQTSNNNHTDNASQNPTQNPGAAIEPVNSILSQTDMVTADVDENKAMVISYHEAQSVMSSPAESRNRRRQYKSLKPTYATASASASTSTSLGDNLEHTRVPADCGGYSGMNRTVSSMLIDSPIAAPLRHNRPRSRSLGSIDRRGDEMQQNYDVPSPVYPQIKRITNNNPSVLPYIDFEVLRPVDGTPDGIAEDITAAVRGRPEPRKFIMCQCDFKDRTHVIVHTFPYKDTFDWNDEEHITRLNCFRAAIIAKTFGVDLFPLGHPYALDSGENVDMTDD